MSDSSSNPYSNQFSEEWTTPEHLDEDPKYVKDKEEDASDSPMSLPSVNRPSTPIDATWVAIPISHIEFNAMRLANDPGFLAKQWVLGIELSNDQRWWRDIYASVSVHQELGPVVLCRNESEVDSFQFGRQESSLSFTWDYRRAPRAL
ncbi:hypothetical protein N7520_000821 [Penicillium odoratum]|uniref:uncharacterized protein n=1 Tax=Penicillium odoratum TaxID=1167516 RepID=UPI0025495262|nr:uncharacterized protein N7520_000821 [Penicillium odoratum]KAJ5777575.1 hypothetical protein N7520_000821 [Penicillium odoratum]